MNGTTVTVARTPIKYIIEHTNIQKTEMIYRSLCSPGKIFVGKLSNDGSKITWSYGETWTRIVPIYIFFCQ